MCKFNNGKVRQTAKEGLRKSKGFGGGKGGFSNRRARTKGKVIQFETREPSLQGSEGHGMKGALQRGRNEAIPYLLEPLIERKGASNSG